jgi:hypothetical protein
MLEARAVALAYVLCSETLLVLDKPSGLPLALRRKFPM